MDPASKVSPFWQEKYRREAGKSWNLFYKRNEGRFFKDRHWYRHELSQLYTPHPKRLLEVGCGVGNFILPLLEDPEILIGHAYMTDFSPKALELLQTDPRFQRAHGEGRATAQLFDLATPSHDGPAIQDIDLCTAIFVLSAIPPECHGIALSNIRSMLRPGGTLFIRDYAKNDAAQLRFKDDRMLGERLYVRQDGTLCYFFTAEEIERLANETGFILESCEMIESQTSNHLKDLTVDRFFLQARLTRKIDY